MSISDLEPWGSVGLPVRLEDRRGFIAQLLTVPTPGALVFLQMLGISARRYLQSVGYFCNKIFALDRFHHRKTLLGTSADTAE